MRTLGYISAAALAATSAAVGVVAIMSWPDVQRYLKIRKM
jgi:L-cysteine desulfidase